MKEKRFSNNLKTVRLEKGFRTMSAFTNFLKVNNGNYSLMENGIIMVSPALKLIFKTLYPEYNIDWIAEGKEPKYAKEMYVRGSESQSTPLELIPFYETTIEGHPEKRYSGEVLTPTYHMYIPEYIGCIAFRAYSDAMANIIQPRDILFGKRINTRQSSIEFGFIYSLYTYDGDFFLRYVNECKNDPNSFLLECENKKYEASYIRKDKIRSIVLMKGWINKSFTI